MTPGAAAAWLERSAGSLALGDVAGIACAPIGKPPAANCTIAGRLGSCVSYMHRHEQAAPHLHLLSPAVAGTSAKLPRRGFKAYLPRPNTLGADGCVCGLAAKYVRALGARAVLPPAFGGASSTPRLHPPNAVRQRRAASRLARAHTSL